MPVTRSSTRAITATVETTTVIKKPSSAKRGRNKRKVTEDEDQQEDQKTNAKKARVTKKVVKTTTTVATTAPAVATQPPVIDDGPEEEESFVPAQLVFSFEDAKSHLIQADPRFEELFERVECKPFEELEVVHPFRALAISILGQQISWLAARSICHRFIRLFNSDIPENRSDYDGGFFPTPRQVARTDIPTLRTAGLSQRKAEYIQDLAARFADGRLSTEKVLAANDEELAKMLTDVRGIGRWTVDMFSIFSLRRPDILPVGDLGVQRGMVHWFLAQQSSAHGVAISPDKEMRKKPVTPAPSTSTLLAQAVANLSTANATGEGEEKPESPPDASSLPPAPSTPRPKKKSKGKKATEAQDSNGPFPVPFTPVTTSRVLRNHIIDNQPPALPEGLTVATLKTRVDGKKKIKGAFLTPGEMELLTESWKPYRSLGVYYMWSLANADGDD